MICADDDGAAPLGNPRRLPRADSTLVSSRSGPSGQTPPARPHRSPSSRPGATGGVPPPSRGPVMVLVVPVLALLVVLGAANPGSSSLAASPRSSSLHAQPVSAVGATASHLEASTVGGDTRSFRGDPLVRIRTDWSCSGCEVVIPSTYTPKAPSAILVVLHGDEGVSFLAHRAGIRAGRRASKHDPLRSAVSDKQRLQTEQWRCWLHQQLVGLAAVRALRRCVDRATAQQDRRGVRPRSGARVSGGLSREALTSSAGMH